MHHSSSAIWFFSLIATTWHCRCSLNMRSLGSRLWVGQDSPGMTLHMAPISQSKAFLSSLRRSAKWCSCDFVFPLKEMRCLSFSVWYVSAGMRSCAPANPMIFSPSSLRVTYPWLRWQPPSLCQFCPTCPFASDTFKPGNSPTYENLQF